MFEKAVAALKAAEGAIVSDLDHLWVPYDPATGTGGLHWHGAGAGALIAAYKSIIGLRSELEAKEPPVPAESVTPEEAPVSDQTVSVPDPEPTPEPEPEPAAEAPVVAAPVEEAVAEPEPEDEVGADEETVTEVEDGA